MNHSEGNPVNLVYKTETQAMSRNVFHVHSLASASMISLTSNHALFVTSLPHMRYYVSIFASVSGHEL